MKTYFNYSLHKNDPAFTYVNSPLLWVCLLEPTWRTSVSRALNYQTNGRGFDHHRGHECGHTQENNINLNNFTRSHTPPQLHSYSWLHKTYTYIEGTAPVKISQLVNKMYSHCLLIPRFWQVWNNFSTSLMSYARNKLLINKLMTTS